MDTKRDTGSSSLDDVSFGAWLRARRRMLDLTQQELADRVGCARITLRRIEADELRPSKELAGILLDRLELPSGDRAAWVAFARGLARLPVGSRERSAASPPNNLPAILTSFIGRIKEMDDISGLLSQHRLVTLAGPGGVGKTRLSLETGLRQLDRMTDGVWLIELAPIASPGLVAQAAAAAMRIQPAPGLPLEELLVNLLQGKRALLIFDNCEHLLDASAYLVDFLLKRCPVLQVLATSREPLGIPGEAIFRVPALAIPRAELLLDLYREIDSVRLFEARARLSGTGFQLAEDNVQDVLRICELLDGIPLAIELAAGRIGQYTAAEISAQLEDSFRLLIGGGRTALPRQQTIRASIDWSWNLLSFAEQEVLRNLSVFSGGWSLESVRAICGEDAVETLGRLLQKSLVNAQPMAGGVTRYDLHTVVRRFAEEKLAESGVEAAVKSRHLDHFLVLVESAGEALRGPEQQRHLSRLDEEQPNLRSALETALKKEDVRAVRLAAALGWYWYRRGLLNEGVAWLDRAMSLPHLEQQALQDPEIGMGLMKATFSAGMLFHFMGNYSRARTVLEKSLALGMRFEDSVGIGRALRLLGMGHIWQGDFESAGRQLEESLAFLRNTGEARELADTQNARGFFLSALGQADAARAALEESLALARSAGDRYGMAMPLANLGTMAYQGGSLEEGRRLLEESLLVGQETGDPMVTTWALKELGHIALAQGDYPRAQSLYERVLADCRAAHLNSGIAEMLRALGDVAVATGDVSGARAFVKESAGIAWQQSDSRSLLFCAWTMARLAAAELDWSRAASLLSLITAQEALIGLVLPQISRDAFDKLVAEARLVLGSETFLENWEIGSRMSLAAFLDTLV